MVKHKLHLPMASKFLLHPPSHPGHPHAPPWAGPGVWAPCSALHTVHISTRAVAHDRHVMQSGYTQQAPTLQLLPPAAHRLNGPAAATTSTYAFS